MMWWLISAGACALGWLALRPRVKRWKYRRCLERVARLEVECGMGLWIGREWFDEQKPKVVRVRVGGSRECLWCGEIYYHTIWRESGPYQEQLCRKCVGTVTRDMAML